jgi:hypothetical protein
MIRLMPKMDDGGSDGPPGRALQTVTLELSSDEAHQLLEALRVWAEEVDEGNGDPAWHTHVADEDGRELTVAITLPAGNGD